VQCGEPPQHGRWPHSRGSDDGTQEVTPASAGALGPPGDSPVNLALQATILDVVETQLREGTPPQARQTGDRLVASGYPEAEARRMIGHAVVSEIFAVLKLGHPYDEARYVAALRRLPLESGPD